MLVPGICARPPRGTSAKTRSDAKREVIGAARYSTGLLPTGIMLSLRRSLSRSAIGCSRPNGPTRLGPRRTWKRPSSRRSAHVSRAKRPITAFASTSDFTIVIQTPSGTGGLSDGELSLRQERIGDGHARHAGAQPAKDDCRTRMLAPVAAHDHRVARLDAEPLGVVEGDVDAPPPLEVQLRRLVDQRPRHQLAVADHEQALRRLGVAAGDLRRRRA